jgi:hypothetical protein
MPQFTAGQLIEIVYQGQDKDTPSHYRGLIDDVKIPKTTNMQLLIVKLDGDNGYKSFYPHKAVEIKIL